MSPFSQLGAALVVNVRALPISMVTLTPSTVSTKVLSVVTLSSPTPLPVLVEEAAT